MSYNTLNEAKAALAALTSTGDALKADLVNLVKQVSVQAQNVSANATTVLYSGMIDGVHSSDIIGSMAADVNVRVVDKTIAADLLNSVDFRTKVAAAFGMTLDDFDNLPSDQPAKQWLFRNADGPWVNVSERFVEATEGKVKLLTLDPDTSGVLYKYEIPKLLEKISTGTSITEVDGLLRDDLLKIGASYSTNWTDVMRNALVDNAITQTHFSKPTTGSYSTFVELTSDGLKDLMKTANASDLNSWHNYLSKFEVPTAATKVLNKLGIIGGLLGFGLAATSAVAEATLKGSASHSYWSSHAASPTH